MPTLWRLLESVKSGRKRWREIEEIYTKRRLKWVEKNKEELCELVKEMRKRGASECRVAYEIFIRKYLRVHKKAPIISESSAMLVFHSQNKCGVLRACEKLRLDTRVVCREVFERPVNELLRALGIRAEFGRNYAKIRPHAPYCEEWFRQLL